MAGLLSDLTGAIQQFVVSPIASFGLAGYVFSSQGENATYLSADITDHYTEDNKAIQDHIAVRPKRVVLKGYVGELVYSAPGSGRSTTQKLAQKLVQISAFAPVLSSAAQQIQQGITKPENISFNGVLNATSNIYGIVKNTFGSLGNTKNQQNAYSYFKALMEAKILMSVQTPWEFVSNMAIESVVAIQEEKSIFISDFSITLKQIRIAQSSTIAFSLSGTGGEAPVNGVVRDGPAALQGEAITNLGATQGTSTSKAIGDLVP